jgi:hypothetical protein
VCVSTLRTRWGTDEGKCVVAPHDTARRLRTRAASSLGLFREGGQIWIPDSGGRQIPCRGARERSVHLNGMEQATSPPAADQVAARDAALSRGRCMYDRKPEKGPFENPAPTAIITHSTNASGAGCIQSRAGERMHPDRAGEQTQPDSRENLADSRENSSALGPAEGKGDGRNRGCGSTGGPPSIAEQSWTVDINAHIPYFTLDSSPGTSGVL